jgi:aminomuconate-semialdehyde/2-hydroxymuconate-6-semialdehyde dehydrogenase
MNLGNFVNGKETPAAAGRTLDNINPATNAQIGTIALSDASDVAAAVAAARRAQPAWAALSVGKRADILHAIADSIEDDLEHLAQLETEDSGKPITTSRTIDIPRAVRNFRFFADFAAGEPLEEHRMEAGYNYTHRRPVGVVGLITPWNLPLYLLTWKVAPALAMGNAVVAKPSEMTPQTASALARIAQEAGLPDGLLNIVHGLGPEAGQAIVEHPDIKAISFTGGTVSGTTVAKVAAPKLKKLSLELGGKNPTIVYDDLPLGKAVEGAVRAAYTNTGQICLCGSRVLVQESIAEEFTRAFIAAVQALPVGDPTDEKTRLGSLISHAHRDKVEGYLRIGLAEGGTVHGGGVPELPGSLAEGAFLRPAVVTGLAQSSRLVQEEIFGPVATVQSFGDEAEAVQLANDVPYGLAATVWSSDLERAKRTAEALDTGMVWINDWLVRDLRVPFGGMKQSGLGREGGTHSLDFFSEPRNIYHPVG